MKTLASYSQPTYFNLANFRHFAKTNAPITSTKKISEKKDPNLPYFNF